MDGEITNAQRLQYVLDLLAEPFPADAQEACGCGENTVKKRDSVRDLVERSLYEALPASLVKSAATLQAALGKMSDEQVGRLLRHLNTAELDLQLRDLALFLDPARSGTTLAEIKQWDLRRANKSQ